MDIRIANKYEPISKEDVNKIGEYYRTNNKSVLDFIGYPSGVIVSGLTIATGTSSITGSPGVALISGNLCELTGNSTLTITGAANTYHIYSTSGSVDDTLTTRDFVVNKLTRTTSSSGVYKRRIDILTLGFATSVPSDSISLGQIVWDGAAITSYSTGTRLEIVNLQNSATNALGPTTGSVFVATGAVSGAITGASGTLGSLISTASGTINTKINTCSGQIDYINTQLAPLLDTVSSYYSSGTATLTAGQTGTAIPSIEIDCSGGFAILVFRVGASEMTNTTVRLILQNYDTNEILNQDDMSYNIGGSINHLVSASRCMVYFMHNSITNVSCKFTNSDFSTDFEWYFCYSIMKV